MKTIPAGKGRAKKVQKPSTTALILNGVCGGGKRGRRPALHKRAFGESSEEMDTAFRLPLNAQIIAELRSPIEDLIAANEALTSSPKIRRRPHIGS